MAAGASPPSPEQQRVERERTPPGFVYVPGGEFVVGSDDPDADDEVRPSRRVFVRSFYIGRTEVSHADWKRFRPEHRIPPGREHHPVTAVALEEAREYCRFAGGRLPTDREWEKAARGTDGRRYPWGDRLEVGRANIREGLAVASVTGGAEPRTGSDPSCPLGTRRLLPVGSLPAGASPYGALNMAGNAWEWVSDAYANDPRRRIIRGGASGYWERDARTYHRAIEGAGVT